MDVQSQRVLSQKRRLLLPIPFLKFDSRTSWLADLKRSGGLRAASGQAADDPNPRCSQIDVQSPEAVIPESLVLAATRLWQLFGHSCRVALKRTFA